MLQGGYELPLVLVSVFVAVFASYTALSLAGRVAHSRGRAAWGWIAGGALAMGTGIWSMHFIGMLAFRLPIPLGYDLGITLLSWAVPIAASALALAQIARKRVRPAQLAYSAVLIGVGINAMHYIGMAALRMQPGIVWNPWLVALSMAIAVGASGASFWVAARLRSHTRGGWLLRSGAALCMGLAIAGMHYTGMAAAGFPADSVCLSANTSFSLTELAMLVIMATVGILVIALITSVFDQRLTARTQVLALSMRTATERQELLERERAARAEAERLSALKDQFLATLSHELRTPLNAILGWVQLLNHRKDEATLARGLETIERNARLQAKLIDDLLDISRIVTGKVRLECDWLDPAQLIEAAIETARPAAVAKQIALDIRLDHHAGRVWGDAARLQQVWWNLLSNAIKFTSEGGRVRITLERQDHAIVAQVRDNGSGIDPQFLPHVFDRFRQGDAGTARRHGGLGIGLSIVRQLVELHGGTVEAESEGLGRGACFSVRLPAGAKAQDRAESGFGLLADAAPPSLAFTPVDLHGLRVLVVDDDADARVLLEQMLRACGAQVVLAAGAEDALRRLAEGEHDVLVSDIGMPTVDGYELVRRVRALDGPVSRVPALALTAFAGAQDEARALQAGFDAFLPKPVDGTALVERVAVLAAARRAA